MPTAMPAIIASASGVSMTLSAPCFRCSPLVARKTPPLTPTSSPRTTTLSSCPSSQSSAAVTASTSVSSAMSVGASAPRRDPDSVELFLQPRRQAGKQMHEHLCGIRVRSGKIGRDSGSDASFAFALQFLFSAIVPPPPRGQISAQTNHGLYLARMFDLFGVAIAAGIVGGGVVADAVGQCLDQAWPLAAPGARGGLGHNLAYGDDVIAVDLCAGHATGYCFLCQRPGTGLFLDRYRNRVTVVDHEEHQRQLHCARRVEGFVE